MTIPFASEMILPGLTRIYGCGDELLYLVQGRESAALIDTGSGAGDLPGFIRTLTDLPVITLVTHGHVDHAGGVPQMDPVYMNYLDAPEYADTALQSLRAWYIGSSHRKTGVTASDYLPQEAYLAPEDAPNLHDLRDGALFPLGGLTIEAVACPGHTAGSMMFLVRELRVLIAGDACTFLTMLQFDRSLPLHSYECSVRNAAQRLSGRFDLVLASHSRIRMPVSLFDEMLEVIEDIRAGRADNVPMGLKDQHGLAAKAFGDNGISRYARLDGKTANLVYRPDRL